MSHVVHRLPPRVGYSTDVPMTDAPREAKSSIPAGLIAQIATVVFSSAALAASAMLLVDYVRPRPVFCGDGGGCEHLQLERRLRYR